MHTSAVPTLLPRPTFMQAALEPLTQLTHLVCSPLRALASMPPAIAELAELQSFGWVASAVQLQAQRVRRRQAALPCS